MIKKQYRLFLVAILLAVSLGAGAFARSTLKPVAENAESTHPLGKGDPVPEGSLWDVNGKSFDLLSAIKRKPTVLIFYRGGWCPFCSRHLKALADIEPELTKLGYQILAIGTDKPRLLKDMTSEMALPYTLLSDNTMEMGRKFGLVFKLEPSYYAAVQRLFVESTGQNNPWLPVPAAYVVDRKGVIRFAYTNPEFRTRVDPQDLLDAAKAVLSTPSH